ncbi:MAG TPA: LuxR C-terminal-related transcriptional regulator [Gaiellaceae bacterium]|nr:LuxR C-terminal-related transcriptional regulator [Gaiellaceae bacterium]
MPRSSSGRPRPEPPTVDDVEVRVPSQPPWAVPRTALVNRLRATPASVVTVIAPAGYGKTTLLGQWAGRDRRPFAWLSIDERDDDPALLVGHVAAALGRVRPDDSVAFESPRPPRASSWRSELQRLAGWLSSSPDVVLVLDDAHLLRSPDSATVISTLAEHVPPGSTLTVAARLTPGLPIGRIRAAGRLFELRTSDLTLTRRESQALLRELEADLAEEDAAELLVRCEGWAAGIHLSALAARERPGAVPRRAVAGGDDRFLAEYFRSEFLSQLTPELRTFLRRTSILEQLTAPVCDAVLERRGSGRVLASFERLHVLVTPLDRHGETYRCHPLLRDLLGRELAQNEPELRAVLHRRAADWFESHGDPESALRHAEGAGDVDRQARIVATIALPAYARGRIADVESWLGGFDDGTRLERYPAVAVIGCWIHALRGRPAAAERWLAAAERGAHAEATRDDGASAGPAIALLRAALCRDGIEQMSSDVERALAGLPPSSPWRPAALVLLGAALLLRGHDALADAIFAEAEESAERLGATDMQISAVSQRSLLASAHGEHAAAELHALRGRALADAAQLDGYATNALELVASARTFLRTNGWDQARSNLTLADTLTPRLTDALPWLAVQTRLELSRAHLALRDAEAAASLLSEALDILRRRPGLGVLAQQASELRTEVDALCAAGERNGSGLTRAELRLLPLLATHLSFREIGTRLHVSRNTVKTQAISVYRKLGVSSRSDAIDQAARLGLVVLP